MKVFLDMDGVLMDFDRALIENGLFVWAHQPGNRTYYHLPPDQWTMEEKEHDADISKLMGTQAFWDGIKPMADAHMLWDYCRQLPTELLTARPRMPEAAAMVSAAKIRSIHRNFDATFPVEKINICLRKEKSLKAPGNILVDDLIGNCQEWTAAGGTAIHYSDAVSTIKILSELYHG